MRWPSQGEVGGSFLTRLQEAEQRKQRAIKALERKIAREKYPFTVPERLVFDPELRKTVTVRPTTKSQRWVSAGGLRPRARRVIAAGLLVTPQSEVKGNFLTRMEQDLAKRAEVRECAQGYDHSCRSARPHTLSQSLSRCTHAHTRH